MKLTEMNKTTLLENIYPILHPQLHSDAVSVHMKGMEDIEMGFCFDLSDGKIGGITNKKNFYGAGAFCVKSIVKDILDFMKCDIFIFPSSKHELIIVPANSLCQDAKELTEMVHQINQDMVEEKDRLSDNVYHLCYRTGVLSTLYYTE